MHKRFIPYAKTEVVEPPLGNSAWYGNTFSTSETFEVPQLSKVAVLMQSNAEANATLHKLGIQGYLGFTDVTIYRGATVQGFSVEGNLPFNRNEYLKDKSSNVTFSFSTDPDTDVIKPGEIVSEPVLLTEESGQGSKAVSISSVLTDSTPTIIAPNSNILYIFENISTVNNTRIELYSDWVEKSYEIGDRP